MSVLIMSFSAAILIVMIAFFRLLLLRIVPKRTFLALWAVALLRLLVPFSPAFTVPLPVPEAFSVPVGPVETVQAVVLQPSPYFDYVSPGGLGTAESYALPPADSLPEDTLPVPELPVMAETPRTATPVWQIVRIAGSALT